MNWRQWVGAYEALGAEHHRGGVCARSIPLRRIVSGGDWGLGEAWTISSSFLPSPIEVRLVGFADPKKIIEGVRSVFLFSVESVFANAQKPLKFLLESDEFS
ncbi:hypothetical protein ACLOJK_021169 [Asimina triloba]